MTADILDISIIVLILLSTIVGLVMGFIKEFLTLGTLLLAFGLAIVYAPVLTPELPFAKDNELLRWGASFGIIFICSMIIGLIISGLLSKAVEQLCLGGFDHVLGALFGLLLGITVITSIVLVLLPSSLPEKPAWKNSRLMPYFQDSAIWVRDSIPDNLAEYIN